MGLMDSGFGVKGDDLGVEDSGQLAGGKRDLRPWRGLYKQARWLRLRQWVLNNFPLCVFCEAEGIATPATVVDHIKAHKGDLTLFWDTGNLQPLCKLCHDSTKQKMERSEDKPVIGLDGWPVE